MPGVGISHRLRTARYRTAEQLRSDLHRPSHLLNIRAPHIV
jgi:hypothetical protein